MVEPSATGGRLAGLNELHEATTKGSWAIQPGIHEQNRIVQEGRGLFGLIADVSTPPEDYGQANTRWIVEAHKLFPELLEELDHLRAENARLKAERPT